ncbi:type II toxin-antitoxin system RelE/ParE family toxin [Luteolibacter sp. Populi]|uniref:type II toxin-antitoxin system RelE/ParE family toxin n=1 Tax=Luteolibacter sp. Populi TaxID=3230487 RepID=UPI003466A82A
MAAPAPRPLEVRFFRNINGREPAREWLQGFSTEEKKIIGADIKVVQWKWPIGKPLVDNLGQGLWEIRTSLGDRIVRVFFFVQNERIIILHGIVKKTQKTPAQDLKLARQRQSLCEQPTEQTNERKGTKTEKRNPPHRK